MKNPTMIYLEYQPDGLLKFIGSRDSSKFIIVPSPAMYEVHAEDYPFLSKKDAARAIETEVISLLPDSPEKYVFDSRVMRHENGGYRAVGISIKRNLLEVIRSEFANVPLFVPVVSSLLERQEGKILIERAGQYDYFEIDSYTAHFEQGYSVYESKYKTAPSKNNLVFQEKRLHLVDKVLVWALGVLIVSASVFLMTDRLAEKYENELIRYGRENSQLVVSQRQRLRLQTEVGNLQTQFLLLENKAPYSAYALLSLLSQIMSGETKIQSVVIKGSGFTIRGETVGALSLVHELETTPGFSGVKIDEISPQEGTSLETFTLSGSFYGH